MSIPSDPLTALELTPADVPSLPTVARRKLASYLLRWEYFDQARRCLLQALVTRPDQVSIYDSLARAYLGLEQPGRALEIMQRREALKVSIPSRMLIIRAHMASGDLETALQVSEALLADHRDSKPVQVVHGNVLAEAGRYDAAKAVFRRLEADDPESVSAARHLARLAHLQNDPTAALAHVQQAVQRYGDRTPPPDFYRLWETLLRETGQSDKADAMAAQLEARRASELDALRHALGQPTAQPSPPPTSLPPSRPSPEPSLPQPSNLQPSTSDPSPDERARLQAALQRHFGFSAFRPGQLEAIAGLLRGQNVLAVMPTGHGKSLVYQLAAQLLPGTTLVISPLIALMKDQLEGLPPGIEKRATTINSTLEIVEIRERLERAASGGYKLIYAAPERFRQRPFLHALAQAGISLLVIDEAHCLSLWGHDFRPDYRFIARAARELGDPTVLTMTATATLAIQEEIVSQLGQMVRVNVDVHRPNLQMEVIQLRNDGEKQHALLRLIGELDGSGVVYANSRAKCEQLAAMLRRYGQDAIHYHAGMEKAARSAAQDRFMSDRARVVVATVAFGMGIDKPDIRFIVHYHTPKSLESYYQEAGRAGRDGLPARCILFHSPSDKGNLTRWTRQEALTLAWLREAYAAVRQRLGSEKVGLAAAADLQRDLQADDTRVRVAVSFLENANLLIRHFDLPRTAMVTISQETAPDGRFDRFVTAARLRPGQPLPLNLLQVAGRAGLDPTEIETLLLDWETRGWLGCRGAGRDMLLEMLPPPPDSSRRVERLLQTYLDSQDARIAAIVSYARATDCRHGTISRYFGGRAIARCKACDNCGATAFQVDVRRAAPTVISEHLTAVILRCVAHLPFSLGRPGLSKTLRGLPAAPVRPERCSEHGALSNLSDSAITQLVDRLTDEGYLEAYVEPRRGFRLLRLTDLGRQALKDESLLPEWGRPIKIEPEAPAAKVAKKAPPQLDEALLERLWTWRRETAREKKVSAFVIFPNAVLQSIASVRPSTMDELAAIKGVGPAKLEKYGPAVIALLRDYENDQDR
jgi:ATP-dependent DNA helicase RecQ